MTSQPTKEELLTSTKRWLKEVVIELNFCPFAAGPFLKEEIKYSCLASSELEHLLLAIEKECVQLKEHPEIETTLIITAGPDDFLEYLDWYRAAVSHMNALGHEGVFQLASFHPDYQFAHTSSDDASNFTNRSPFPIFHILREESVSRAVESHPDVDGIPLRNMSWSRERGFDWMMAKLEEVCQRRPD